jgi:hypothetical protein
MAWCLIKLKDNFTLCKLAEPANERDKFHTLLLSVQIIGTDTIDHWHVLSDIWMCLHSTAMGNTDCIQGLRECHNTCHHLWLFRIMYKGCSDEACLWIFWVKEWRLLKIIPIWHWSGHLIGASAHGFPVEITPHAAAWTIAWCLWTCSLVPFQQLS